MGSERHVKLFKNGRSQAVRIPREFELPGEDAMTPCAAGQKKKEFPINVLSAWRLSRPCSVANPNP
jgi:hypothetical protein